MLMFYEVPIDKLRSRECSCCSPGSLHSRIKAKGYLIVKLKSREYSQMGWSPECPHRRAAVQGHFIHASKSKGRFANPGRRANVWGVPIDKLRSRESL